MNEEVIKEFLVSIGYKTDETSLKRFTASLASVTKTVMKLGAAVAATAVAVVAGVKVISGEMERLYYASQRTGETVGNIMALRYAAGQIGLTADQAQASLEGFTRALRLNPGMNGLLSQLGVTGKGPVEQFESFIGKMKQMQPYIAAQYASLFGIDPDTLLMLENGLPKIQAAQEKYRQKLSAFGINPEQAADAGRAFDNSIRDLTGDIHLFWVLLQEHLAPVLAKIATEFERWESGHADEVARKIASALEAVAKWVSEINWSEVGKDVDIFLDKAGKVAEVIGNIVGGVAKLARWFGGDGSEEQPAQPAATPDNGDQPPGTIIEVPAPALQKSSTSGARAGDSPFIGWLRNKVQSLHDRFDGTPSSTGAAAVSGSRGQQGAPSAGPSSGPAQAQTPRGIRNNNPGNIRYGEFAKSAGATGADSGGFAVFSDMQAGMEATAKLLHSYADRGFNTIRKIISRWAPANENDTQAYIANVAKQLGVSADLELNGEQLRGVAGSIFQHENGSVYGKLGAGGASAASKSVTISQKTDVHVHGSPDPGGTGRAVAGEQARVNADLVRNMTGAYV
ncbi:hypothetical protein [Caballeronia telluris]|uniref:Mannosyl-glycoprotein endo-beta-N-acetylglucosamidase n=1 Tax=Caballeronia telluris TaxID=326475 RepID=A0A158G0M5_9BURK|nr:hypothetical protein [Caballeronia telluris]SAL25688.1 mannosyl-glycoprotein endo-beta-N-acetylglucosamidase [Caballeronia telluris]